MRGWSGATRILLPMASEKDILTVPGDLLAKFQTGFYADPIRSPDIKVSNRQRGGP